MFDIPFDTNWALFDLIEEVEGTLNRALDDIMDTAFMVGGVATQTNRKVMETWIMAATNTRENY